MNPKHHKSREPSQRQLRVAELMRHVLAESLLHYDFGHNSRLLGAHISVAEVRVSPDFSHATIFVNELQGAPDAAQLAELNRLGGGFRKILATQLRLKRIPRLHFVGDEAAIAVRRIDSVLHSLSEKHDKEA